MLAVITITVVTVIVLTIAAAATAVTECQQGKYEAVRDLARFSNLLGISDFFFSFRKETNIIVHSLGIAGHMVSVEIFCSHRQWIWLFS